MSNWPMPIFNIVLECLNSFHDLHVVDDINVIKLKWY